MEWNRKGIIKKFNNMEGYYPMDGSCGISIIHVDKGEYDDFDIEQIL